MKEVGGPCVMLEKMRLEAWVKGRGGEKGPQEPGG